MKFVEYICEDQCLAGAGAGLTKHYQGRCAGLAVGTRSRFVL